MKRRMVLLLTAVPALVAGLLAAGAGWLLHSESGARWLFARLQAIDSFTLEAESVSGDLGGGLRILGMSFENEAARVHSDSVSLAVNLDLLPPAINVSAFRGGSVEVELRQVPQEHAEPDAEIDIAQIMEELALPVPFRLGHATVDSLDVIGHDGRRLVRVEAATLSGTLHQRVEALRLQVRANGHEMTLSGDLGLSAPHPVNLELRVVGALLLNGSIGGTLAEMQLEFATTAPDAHLSGSLLDALDSPSWDLQLRSAEAGWPLDGAEPDVRVVDLQASSRGQPSNYRLDLEADVMAPGLEDSRLELNGAGNLDGFSAQMLRLDGPALSLESKASVSWSGEPSVQIEALLKRLDPNHWLGDWPDGQPLSGAMNATWSGDDLSVSNFSLAADQASFKAEGSGVIDLAAGRVDGEFSWRDLNWPPASSEPVFSSRLGRFDVAGSPGDWRLEGALDVRSAGFPESRLRLEGTGNQESAQIQLHEGSLLGGRLAGTTSFGWTGEQPFQASVRASGVNTTALLEQFPGTFDAELGISGQLQPLQISADIQRLDGIVRQLPVHARGAVHYREGLFSADGLVAESGGSSVILDGDPRDSGGIEFSADIPSFAEFGGDLAGSLSGRGTLVLGAEYPTLLVDLTAAGLVIGDLAVEAIETQENRLSFSGVTIGATEAQQVMLEFSPGEPLREIALLATLDDNTVRLGLQGSVVDWSDPLGRGWAGRLTETIIRRGDRFELSLERPAELALAGDRFEIANACFDGTFGGRLCANSSWTEVHGFTTDAELSGIPVGVAGVLLDTDLRFNQKLSGAIQLARTAAGRPSGTVSIGMSPGEITLEGDDERFVATGPARFGFVIQEGRLEQGDLSIHLPQSGDIDIDFSAGDLRRGVDSQIQGRAVIDLRDIGLAGRLFPVLDTIDGILDVDLALSGTIANPEFSGRAILSDGALGNSASGFSFTGINLSGKVDKSDTATLSGSFRAGEGDGVITATIDFSDLLDPAVDISLQGEHLTLIDVPDLSAVANPDLELSWREKTVHINGRIEIPAVRLAPRYLPQSSISQSSDVVIVAGEKPEAEQDFFVKNAVRVEGELDVELGEDVVVDLNIAQIDVTGAARFSWRGEPIPLANGSFDATGDIQAYGQFLQVTQGRISFPNSPADNPHLNVRAEREIFGNSQVRRAGLMVTGTLNRPIVEPYTVPMTNKERAQTLLVTGSDFNYEQGVGAVDVGMYVLPRLYISYGIGVFEDGNVLKARYDLGRGFGIRATSGQRETGLDISYTIER